VIESIRQASRLGLLSGIILAYVSDMHPDEQLRWQERAPVMSDDAFWSSWQARLELDFSLAPATEPDKTRLHHKHFGPLRIQKALYPEGASPCHAIIVHPPGGIAAGDRLEVNVACEAGTHGLVTTPSAAKWYGADSDNLALQHIDMELDGSFEWLPQETIVFNRARVASNIAIRIADKGAMIGWDHLIFGRQASGETFAEGSFKQTLRLEVSGELVWLDRMMLMGADPLFMSPIGLRGHFAFATCWAVMPGHKEWGEASIQTLRQEAKGVAWTVLHPRVVVGRILAPAMDIKFLLQAAWTSLRPIVLERKAVAPRLWAT
jgi:urease accessory protein